MICQASPIPASRGETLCSLQFASRAKSVELGKASARRDNSAEVIKAKAEAKKALDSHRTLVADLAAAKSSAATAAESETAARARESELTNRVAALEREAAASTNAHRELESVRGLLRAEREVASARLDEVERLKRDLKEQVSWPHSSVHLWHVPI